MTSVGRGRHGPWAFVRLITSLLFPTGCLGHLAYLLVHMTFDLISKFVGILLSSFVMMMEVIAFPYGFWSLYESYGMTLTFAKVIDG